MKTVETAINRIYSVLKGTGGLSCPVYKNTKPTEITPNEYAVINALPITSGVLQRCRVNVNYHVKDLKDGISDNVKLEAASAKIMSLLESFSDTTNKIYIYFENQRISYDETVKNHYSNFRFIVDLIN